MRAGDFCFVCVCEEPRKKDALRKLEAPRRLIKRVTPGPPRPARTRKSGDSLDLSEKARSAWLSSSCACGSIDRCCSHDVVRCAWVILAATALALAQRCLLLLTHITMMRKYAWEVPVLVDGGLPARFHSFDQLFWTSQASPFPQVGECGGFPGGMYRPRSTPRVLPRRDHSDFLGECRGFMDVVFRHFSIPFL